MASSSIIAEPSPPIEQGSGSRTVVVFAGNAKYLVGGGKLKAIHVRRVADGQQIASMEAKDVTCLAISPDGRWFAAGTAGGDVLRWDAKTYERVFEHKEPLAINYVEFFHDGARFFASHNRTATVWDIGSGQQIQTYDHKAKQTPTLSQPQGGPVAVTTENSIRVYDKHDGRLLAEIPVQATSSRLCWLGYNLVVISGDKIKRFKGFSGSKVAEWPVPYSEHSCITRPVHDGFIAYCANHTVTFWDTSTHAKTSLVELALEISSISFSPDDQLLAVGGLDGEVVIQCLRGGLLSDYTSAPCIHFDDAVLEDTPVDVSASLADTTSAFHHQSDDPSVIISLVRVLIKRSKAYVADGLWELALDDANKVIELDPMSPWGYQMKHAALHMAGDYDNAFNAFETMLSKMSQSSNPHICKLQRYYVNPTHTREAIRHIVQDTIRDSPTMLINTASGQLLDKSEQAALFESQPVFNKLLSSMTTIIDHTRIEHDVKKYYRYAILSHTWQDNELLFERVIHTIIYHLEDSPANNKLKMFCKIVRDAGFHWAWSDACCINRKDDFVLQEVLVPMLRWYQGSALTLVLLHGVKAPSRRGDLLKSIWNTCAWASQEYHASKVLLFYNEDWTLYRDINESNHKESHEILSEVEEATGISTPAMKMLQPGLNNIRKLLTLISRRQVPLVGDSLLGMFLPAAHGGEDPVLGRLLAQILSSSGDASILAWAGKSGSFNSCLPSCISAFNQLPTSHIPSSRTDSEMGAVTAALTASSFDLDLVINLYDRLQELPAPFFLGRRMRLPCLRFQLRGPSSVSWNGLEWVFNSRATGLGDVEIWAAEDLSQLDSLILVHPWIDFLLGRSAKKTIPEASGDDPNESPSTCEPSSSLPSMDKYTAALQLIARLRQPFGALLLAPTGQGVVEYRRVASESLITVQIQDDTLDDLLDCIQILAVL